MNNKAINEFGFRIGYEELSRSRRVLSITPSSIYLILLRKPNSLTANYILDLNKAFDTLDHSIMLDKLTSLGMNRSAVQWFRSYSFQLVTT